MECCRDGCPSGMFSHLHRGTLELCQSDHHHFYPSPDLCLATILSRRSKGNSFDFMALTCTFNCGTLYRPGCAFPNHVQSIEFMTSGLQSSCTNISRMINGNRIHPSSILNGIAKGLNNYANLIFQFFYFINVQKTGFLFVIMGYCV